MSDASNKLGLLHRTWRLLPARQRRNALAWGTALLAPRPDQPPPPAAAGIAVGGEIGRASGLGEGARLMLHGLDALVVRNWPIDTETRGPMPAPPGVPLVLHINAPQLPLALLRLGRAGIAGRRIVGYWAWELPVLAPDWRAAAALVHEAWVPSQFTAAALEPLLPGRVRVVPPPTAVRPPAPSILGRADFGLPADAVLTVCAFSMASSFERKNPLAAIAAHREAFGSRADRILVLKVNEPDHYPDDMARLRAAADGLPNIRFETRTLPAADHHALMAACDIVLSLHRSEGYGSVLAEAMLLGKPVVATAWSGNMDFMDSFDGQPCAAPVPCRLVAAQDRRGVYQVPGAVWAEADIRAAADHLRRLADSAEARATLGTNARRAAQARLGPGKLAEAIRALGLPMGVA